MSKQKEDPDSAKNSSTKLVELSGKATEELNGKVSLKLEKSL